MKRTRAELEKEFDQVRLLLLTLTLAKSANKRLLCKLDRRYNQLFDRLFPELK